MLEGINHLAKIMQTEGIFKSYRITDVQRKKVKEKVSLLHLNFHFYHRSLDTRQGKVYFLIEEEREKKLVSFIPLERAPSVHSVREVTPNRVRPHPDSLTEFTPTQGSDDGFIADKILNLDVFLLIIS